MSIKKWLNLEYYISELDQFLTSRRHKNPKASLAQAIEIKKYQRIHSLRDDANTPSPKNDLVTFLE